MVGPRSSANPFLSMTPTIWGPVNPSFDMSITKIIKDMLLLHATQSGSKKIQNLAHFAQLSTSISTQITQYIHCSLHDYYHYYTPQEMFKMDNKFITSDTDTEKGLSPIELKREKNRRRVAEYRRSLTSEQKAEINRKRRERRAAQKKEQRIVKIFYDRREKSRKRQAAYRQSLTPEQKAEMNRKIRERREEKRRFQTEEAKSEINKIRREKRAAKLESLTLEEQIRYREKERLRVWEYRHSLPLEKKAEIRRKDRETKSLSRRKTEIVYSHEFCDIDAGCPSYYPFFSGHPRKAVFHTTCTCIHASDIG